MGRRQFILKIGLAVGGQMTSPLLAAPKSSGSRIRWTQTGPLFTAVTCDGYPMTPNAALLSADCRVAGKSWKEGPLCVTVAHRLYDSGAGLGEDMLAATLTVHNVSQQPQDARIEFATAARPSPEINGQRVYLHLCAAGLFGDGRFAALGVKNFLTDGNHPVGIGNFAAHYLEPMASHRTERETQASLLAPVVDVFDQQRPWHIALFTPSDQAMRFSRNDGLWRAGRQVTVGPGRR
jgi:hypothetical protein